MPFSERSREGWLMIDHRAGYGVDQEALRRAGINAPGVPGGVMFEAPTITCSHCGGAFVINPMRTRERARCGKCFRYLCDGCGAAHKQSLECAPFQSLVGAASGL
jgi:hypothetical protein